MHRTLVLWDYLVFLRWRTFGCKGGHERVGIVQKIDMFGYKAHEWFESKKREYALKMLNHSTQPNQSNQMATLCMHDYVSMTGGPVLNN